MLNNSTFYNITFDLRGTPQIETTITKIFMSLQSQVLNSFLYSQIIFLGIIILTLELTHKKDCTWEEIFLKETDMSKKQYKILRTLCYIGLPLAIYGTLLCISIKMELNL